MVTVMVLSAVTAMVAVKLATEVVAAVLTVKAKAVAAEWLL